MKKIFFLLIGIIIVPYLIIVVFNNKKEMTEEIEEIYKIISKKNVRILRNDTNEIITIPIEEYVLGVVAGEMPITFEIEALKAQAVAARSYVLKRMEYNKNKDYDVIDTVKNQVYLDYTYLKERWKNKYEDNIKKLKKVIKETQNEYVLYDGVVADTLFFSTSNGSTENSEDIFQIKLPYLVSVKSPWDEKETNSFYSKKEFSLTEFCKLLDTKCVEKYTFNITKQTNTGRVINIQINDKIYESSELYTKLKIRSTSFSVEQQENKIIFYTKGYGHGVGMSQYGAQGMAKEGYTYKEILKHYYSGTTVEKI